MPTLRKYRVFISHVWRYHDDYERVVQFLDAEPYFDWENLSVPVDDPVDERQLEYNLRARMRDAAVVLIIAGMYAANREMIDFELRFSRRIGRPIIGIRKWASQRMPITVALASTAVVGWTGPGIVSAIRRHSLPPTD